MAGARDQEPRDKDGISEAVRNSLADNEFFRELAIANQCEPTLIVDMFIRSHTAVASSHGTSGCDYALAQSSSSCADPAPRMPATARLGVPSEADARAARVQHFQSLVHLLHPEVRDDDLVQERLWKAIHIPAIVFCMPSAKTNEGHVLRAAMDSVKTNTGLFKIGITQDPAHRWSNPEYGYVLYGYNQMRVIFCSPSPTTVGMLEASLIAMAKVVAPHRCENIAPGGEAKTRAKVLFAYVVMK